MLYIRDGFSLDSRNLCEKNREEAKAELKKCDKKPRIPENSEFRGFLSSYPKDFIPKLLFQSSYSKALIPKPYSKAFILKSYSKVLTLF